MRTWSNGGLPPFARSDRGTARSSSGQTARSRPPHSAARAHHPWPTTAQPLLEVEETRLHHHSHPPSAPPHSSANAVKPRGFWRRPAWSDELPGRPCRPARRSPPRPSERQAWVASGGADPPPCATGSWRRLGHILREGGGDEGRDHSPAVLAGVGPGVAGEVHRLALCPPPFSHL